MLFTGSVIYIHAVERTSSYVGGASLFTDAVFDDVAYMCQICHSVVIDLHCKDSLVTFTL